MTFQDSLLRSALLCLLLALGLLAALAFNAVYATYAYATVVNVLFGSFAPLFTLLGVNFLADACPEDAYRPIPFWKDLAYTMAGLVFMLVVGYIAWHVTYSPAPSVAQQLWGVLFLFAWSSIILGGFGISIFNKLLASKLKGKTA